MSAATNRHHDYNSCEKTRGVDNLLLQYQQDRNNFVDLVINDPTKLITTTWKQGSILAIDKGCRCKMGDGQSRTSFTCSQCKNLRRLINFSEGLKPFQIQCGSHTGKVLMISKVNITEPFLAWNNNAASRAKKYIDQYRNVVSCGTPDIPSLRCITGDSFTIRAIITWALYIIFKNKELPHIPNLRTTFICNNVGYSLYDMPTIGTIIDFGNNLNVEVVKTIIIQLLVILTELSSLNFSHGDPTSQAITFLKEPVSYKYDNYHVRGSVTVQIADMWNSSATFNNIHYFSNNIETSMHIEKNLFVPEIVTKVDNESYFYCLRKDTTDIYIAMRHIGFPLYVGSFDFYCFMVSLMCNKSFYYFVATNENLRLLWITMWLQEDIFNIQSRIEGYHQGKNNYTPVDMIKGVWLRCNIVKYIWKLVKEIFPPQY